MIDGFLVQAMENSISWKLSASIRGIEMPGMALGHAMDIGGSQLSRIPKMPLTHFFRKSTGPGFDVLVLLCVAKTKNMVVMIFLPF